jgi:hypothetical protein
MRANRAGPIPVALYRGALRAVNEAHRVGDVLGSFRNGGFRIPDNARLRNLIRVTVDSDDARLAFLSLDGDTDVGCVGIAAAPAWLPGGTEIGDPAVGRKLFNSPVVVTLQTMKSGFGESGDRNRRGPICGGRKALTSRVVIFRARTDWWR